MVVLYSLFLLWITSNDFKETLDVIHNFYDKTIDMLFEIKRKIFTNNKGINTSTTNSDTNTTNSNTNTTKRKMRSATKLIMNQELIYPFNINEIKISNLVHKPFRFPLDKRLLRDCQIHGWIGIWTDWVVAWELTELCREKQWYSKELRWELFQYKLTDLKYRDRGNAIEMSYSPEKGEIIRLCGVLNGQYEKIMYMLSEKKTVNAQQKYLKNSRVLKCLLLFYELGIENIPEFYEYTKYLKKSEITIIKILDIDDPIRNVLEKIVENRIKYSKK